MKSALVKIDVAADITGKAIPALFDMADGAALIDEDGGRSASLTWVFDLANGEKDARRDLRFWRGELETFWRTPRAEYTIDQVIYLILPITRTNFHAGEVDQLFQIRHNTRRELLDSAGMTSGRNFYSRDMLAAFLKSRWLGRRPIAVDHRLAVQPSTRPLTDKAGAIARPDKGTVLVASQLNRI